MSFQNYENFPSQQAGQDGGTGNTGPPPQQENQINTQIPTTPGGQFEGGPQVQPPQGAGQEGGDAKTTLWMGELEPWMDENFIRTVWYNMGESVNVKMIRDKFSG